MSKHPVFFIGAGPGSPRFLTLEGKAALEESRTVYAVDPYRRTFGKLLAGKAVDDPLDFPFAEIVRRVKARLREGPVAFLIPGDLTVFSPYMPLVERFRARARIIPGVGIINAAASLLGVTLEVPGLSPCVILASPKHLGRGAEAASSLARMAALRGTLVLYMNDRPLPELAALLRSSYPPSTPAALVHRAGMKGEKVLLATLATLERAAGKEDASGFRGDGPSLSLILVGDALRAKARPEQWDRRKRLFWDRREKKG